MSENSTALNESFLNALLAFWILLPFLVRSFIFKLPSLRLAFPKMQENSISRLYHSYIVACSLLLPIYFLFFSLQPSWMRWLLLIIAICTGSKMAFNLRAKKGLVSNYRFFGLSLAIAQSVLLILGLLFLKFELQNALNLQLNAASDELIVTNMTSTATWAAYVYLFSTVLIGLMQLYAEFLYLQSSSNSALSIHAAGTLQRIELLCIAFGFFHLFFQSCIMLFEILSGN